MTFVDQGSVIHGLFSKKYPDNSCYGIVISARCDIANGKINKVYYLSAVDVKEWAFSEYGYNEIIRQQKNNILESLDSISKEHGLDLDTLLSFSQEHINRVIEQEVPSKKQKQFSDLLKKYNECVLSTRAEKTAFLKSKKGTDCFVDTLGRIYSGRTIHYFYLPKSTFTKSTSMSDGLIVDLQEIDYIPFTEIEKIQNGELDYSIMNEEERAHYAEHYWLKDKDDFVLQEGIIQSPWCEHLMQRFSFGFIRIGVDGPTKSDYERIIEIL